jgi:hypothetical protein
MGRGRLGLRLLAWSILAMGAGLLAWWPAWAPGAVGIGVATAVAPLVRGWRGARGTALRAALAWGGLALALGMVAQAWAWGELWESGRPGAGQWAYLSVLAALAASISVLNARRPGGGAWALLMGLLVLVFLVPWLEGAGLARGAGGWDRLRLDAPWTLFYGLLVLAGVTNYLPTRYGPASAWLALAFALEYLGLTHTDWPATWRGRIWSAAPWSLAAAAWAAEGCAGRDPGPPGLGRLWAWFRDHWGVVWALRVRERFDRAAEAAGWPVRLSWHGPVPVAGRQAEPVPAAAEATLKGLLRRFADPSRLDEAAGRRE